MDTPVTSASITVTGITIEVPISVSGGEYSIGCTASFTSAPGIVTNGQAVCVRHLSSSRPISATSTTLAISALSATFTSTTRRADPVVDLVASANPARLGKPVRFVATVRSPFGSPTGFVTFRAGTSVVIGCERVPVINEVAECITDTLPAGRRGIAARYEGNEQFNARESAELMLYVKSFLRSAFRDLQGDGNTDFVLERADGAAIARLVKGTSTYAETELLPAGSAWKVTHFADFDGDGKADLVLQNGRGDIETWMMDGTQPTLRERFAHSGDGLSVVGVGDFDGDGNDDLLVAESDDSLSVETVGGLAAGKRTKLLPALRASSVTHMGDFDGDGRADILMLGPLNEIVIWVMSSDNIAGVWTPHGPSAWQVIP